MNINFFFKQSNLEIIWSLSLHTSHSLLIGTVLRLWLFDWTIQVWLFVWGRQQGVKTLRTTRNRWDRKSSDILSKWGEMGCPRNTLLLSSWIGWSFHITESTYHSGRKLWIWHLTEWDFHILKILFKLPLGTNTIFYGHTQAYRSSWPGVKSKPQLQQCQVRDQTLVPVMTPPFAVWFLTHYAREGIQ